MISELGLGTSSFKLKQVGVDQTEPGYRIGRFSGQRHEIDSTGGHHEVGAR